MNVSDLISSTDFCQVVSDKFVEHGVKRNHLVYVAGLRALPVAEEDPYTQRVKCLVHLVDGKNHVIWDKLYLMDPHSLQKVKPMKKKRLTEILKNDLELVEVPHLKEKDVVVPDSTN